MSNPYAPPSPDRARAGGPAGAPTADGDPTDPADPAGPAGPGPSGPGHPLPPHPAPGPHPPRPHPGPAAPPPTPEALASVGRLVRHFGVWLLAGVAVSLLPLPWRFASAAFLVGAVVAGVRALLAVARSGLKGGVGAMLVAGLLVAGLVLVGSVGSLATWRIDADRQDCLAGALTRSAQAACERAYDDALGDLTGRLTGGRG